MCANERGVIRDNGGWALEELRFSAASDVYAFGVLMFEVMARQNLAMLTRSSGYLALRPDSPPAAVESLQNDGYVLLKAVVTGEDLAALRADVERVFAEYPPDERGDLPEQSDAVKAATASLMGSGDGTTAASATASCSISTLSSSNGLMR